MNKISIVYWSNGGNVEMMANAIADGARVNKADVNVKHVVDVSIEELAEADAIALGSPAMVDDYIEQIDMKPFVNSLKGLNFDKKPLVLFGSSGWRDDKFIHKWSAQMEDCGFEVIGKLAVKESLSKEEIKIAENLGSTLVNIVNKSC